MQGVCQVTDKLCHSLEFLRHAFIGVWVAKKGSKHHEKRFSAHYR